MHVLFSSVSESPVQVCALNESTFSLECCRQSVSGWVLPCRELIDKQTLLFDNYKLFICIYWKSKFLEVCLFICFVAAQVYTHTSLLHSTQTPRAFDPSAFYFQGEDANVRK